MAFIVAWEFIFKDKIDSVEVVVVKAGEKIERKEKITEDKVMIERRTKKDLIQNVVYPSDLNKILGKEASQLIVSNSMISTDMIDFDDLIPNAKKHEAIRPIPQDWIYAAPGSLRRKDRIDIYTIKSESLDKLKGSDQASSTQNVVEVGIPTNEVDPSLLTLVLADVPVIYAKDASNKEVVNQVGNDQQQQDDGKRLNATGKISELEILLNDKDFNKLVDSIFEKSGRLYITYN